MAVEQAASDAAFAAGMAMMLLLPLCAAVCVAWCRCRRTASEIPDDAERGRMLTEMPPAASGRHKWDRVRCVSTVSSANSDSSESEDEQQALHSRCARPPSAQRKQRRERLNSAAQALTSKMRRHGSSALPFEWNHLTLVHFRRSDWEIQRRKPLTTKVALHNVHTMQVSAATFPKTA